VEQYGIPLAVYSDRHSIFGVAPILWTSQRLVSAASN
jgi:hypothetical protein